MFNREEKIYQQALKALFNSDDGKKVLVEWRKRFVYTNPFADTQQETNANVAIKQFVINLMQALKDEDLDKIEERYKSMQNEERDYD